MSLRVAALVGGAVFVSIASGAGAQEAPKTVLDGVFTAAQADRGSAVYGAKCAECHEGADVDGPPLTGMPFLDRWREDSLGRLFEFIKANMPQQAPGSLPDAVYLDVVAHLLRENSLPAGSRELTMDVARDTVLVGPNGPQPLPNGALVQVVGCLARSPNREWVVVRAGRPSRVRAGTEITATEATAAAAAPPGTQTFALQDADGPGSGLGANGTGGQKVIVKGALSQRADGGRIHVTAAKIIADSCGEQARH